MSKKDMTNSHFENDTTRNCATCHYLRIFGKANKILTKKDLKEFKKLGCHYKPQFEALIDINPYCRWHCTTEDTLYINRFNYESNSNCYVYKKKLPNFIQTWKGKLDDWIR